MAVITFAHRGARADQPENTIAAFCYALAHGARGLETDAWLAADGEVVLVHNEHVRQGLKKLSVRESTAAVLHAVDVPTLDELYAECGNDYDLSIDIKDRKASMPMIDAIRANGRPERTWLCSASRSLLEELRPQADDVRLVHSPGQLPVSGTGAERYFADLNADNINCVNLHHTAWSRGLVELAHRFGLEAFAWDVQEVRRIRAVLRMGIDGLFSDHVDRMVATVGEWHPGDPD